MENRIRLVGLVATAVFAAALTSCAGSSSDNITGSGGSSASGGNGGGRRQRSGDRRHRRQPPAAAPAARRERRQRGGTWNRRTATGGSGGSGTAAPGTGAAAPEPAARPAAPAGRGTGGGGRRGNGRRQGRRRRDRHRRPTASRRAAAAGTGGATTPACSDNMRNGTETGVDCGGSCPACPNYKINAPEPATTAGSGCNGGPAGSCARATMVFSPEFKQAETDDFGSPTNPQFVYGVVGHDQDAGGLDTNGGNACCQCYQLIFDIAARRRQRGADAEADDRAGVQHRRPAAGRTSTSTWGGGVGRTTGATRRLSNAHVQRATRASARPIHRRRARLAIQPVRAGNMNVYSSSSIATMSCQIAIASRLRDDHLEQLDASRAPARARAKKTNQPQNLYHINWNVLRQADRMPDQPDTRHRLQARTQQGLPTADPTAVDTNVGQRQRASRRATPRRRCRTAAGRPALTRQTSCKAAWRSIHSMARSTPAM